MHRTNSGSRAVIPTQKEPSADESGATNEPRAIDLNSNAERIDLERDLQIASGLNGQQRPRRTLRPTFKVQENQLITDILQQSIDLRNRHALMVLLTQCMEDADPKEPKTLEEALSGPNRTQWLAAAHAEVKSLRAKGVYCLVDRSPKMKVLGGKWVFKLKRD
jgi:hypothetical protein